MHCIGLLSGGAPVIKRFQVAATAARLGVPYLTPAAAAGAGLAVCTTTATANMVGCNLDLATYATAQGATSPEALISVIINPDAIWSIIMSGGAASGTAEVVATVTTASTDGLVVTTSAKSWASPEMDEGWIWGVSGANAGQQRRVTTSSSTAATVTVAFANDTVVGDTFSWSPFSPYSLHTITLTTELDEYRQDVAVATNTARFGAIEYPVNDWLGSSRRPRVRAVSTDHVFQRLA